MGRSEFSIPFSGPPLCGFPLSGSSQVSPLGGVGSWTDPRGQEDAVLGSDLAPLLPQFPLCRLLEIINGNPARWGPRPCLI